MRQLVGTETLISGTALVAVKMTKGVGVVVEAGVMAGGSEVTVNVNVGVSGISSVGGNCVNPAITVCAAAVPEVLKSNSGAPSTAQAVPAIIIAAIEK